MKKIIWIVLTIFLLITLVGCGDTVDGKGHIISFDTGVEDYSIPSQEVNYGELVKEPDKFERFGYEFSHWGTETLNRPWRFETDIPTSDLELYAVWNQVILELSFEVMSEYNYSDGIIELNFEVYYESNKVDLINEINEIYLFDGDEEVSYDLKGENYITINSTLDEPIEVTLINKDNAKYKGFIDVNNYMNNLIFQKEDELIITDDNYYEQYKLYDNNNELISFLSSTVYVSYDNETFQKYENKFNNQNLLIDIETLDASYKFFLITEEGSFITADLSYKKSEYYKVDITDNIKTDSINLNKVLEDTVINIELIVPEGKQIKKFTVNGENYIDKVVNNELELKVNEDLNVYLELEDVETSEIRLENKEVTYTGETITLEVIDLPDGYYVLYENNVQVNAGVYDVKAYIYDESNELLVKELKATLTINKKELNIEFKDKDIKYDGSTHSLEIEGDIPSDILINYINNDKTYPGKHEVTAIILTNNNYTINGTLKANLNIYYEVTYHNLYDDNIHKNYDTWLDEPSLETFYEDYEFIGYYLDSKFNNKLPSEYHLDGHTDIYMKYEFTKELTLSTKDIKYDGNSHSLKINEEYNDDDIMIQIIDNNKTYPGIYNIKALVMFKSESIKNIILESELRIYYEITYKAPNDNIVFKNYNTWLEVFPETTSYNDNDFLGYYLDEQFLNELPNEYHLNGHTEIYMKYDIKTNVTTSLEVIDGYEVYVTTINRNAIDGGKIVPKIKGAYESVPTNKKPVKDFVNNNLGKYEVVINAGKYNVSNSNYVIGGTEGVLIIDGVIIDNNPHPKYHVLAIDDTGNIKTFVGKTGDEILAEGYKNATTAFAPVILDGEKLAEGYIDITGGAKTPAKRQILSIDAEGNYEIYSFKSSITFEKSRDLLFNRGISFAYQLDGGGSTSLYVQDQEIYDVESRPIIDVIVFEIIQKGE